ncbi:VanW family protein [Priestia megaterium]|uniref:VanW family protein n=1 Tax=Priestia megaterium TaxID=1404 RepID=UPI002B2461C1|nr:VanW family protein [Priestia megaterium]MEB2266248.1 VanW family protein [Priestia megaterium]
MNFTWMVGLLMLIQPLSTQDHLSITHDGKPIERIERDKVAVPLLPVPMVDHDRYNLLLEELDKKTYREPINARIDKSGQIVPEQAGVKLYHKDFAEKFYTYFFNGGTSTLEIPTLPVPPRVDKELLATIRIKQIGHYHTVFNPHNKNRSHNISLAAESLDSSVIFPGEVFSFNQTVGKRTAAKGYTRAPIIVKGEYSEGVGGGICQVSSTLFNAVDNAGVTITQRYSHSRSVSYVPPGRDATVSWYGPDFHFKNTYSDPLLIRAQVHGGVVSVAVYSTDAIEYKPRRVPWASIDQLPKEKKIESHVDTEPAD